MADPRTDLRLLADRIEHPDVKRIAKAGADEIVRLQSFIAHVETATATGDGLTPDETIVLHQQARLALDNEERSGE